MHIVTFYSFKGGVGRTMGLVNIAADLTQRGQKVLLVDFDLEAPGLSAYREFAQASMSRGIVEYVSEFIETASAPDANEFITECKLVDKPIWIMPAGMRNAGYSAQLNSIDWQTLYSAQNGFLMFEDLKQQWQHRGFDYVLIDSRTGHTDVGGICTRHLPHAVVLMFFPNDQNLLGLATVAEEIRQESSTASREEPIILHYCASNVPDIDDEAHILERKLGQAKERLKYEGEPQIIHYYNSLSLIEQSVFVVERPESKLAKEYRQLSTQVAASNLGDLSGALARLRKIRGDLRENPDRSTSSALVQTLSKIDELHPGNAEVQLALASIYFQLGQITSEYACLTRALNNGSTSSVARRRRAEIASLQGRRSDAINDLQLIINDENATSREFVSAVELLRALDAKWPKNISELIGIRTFDLTEASRLGRLLMTEKTVPLAIPVLKRTLALPVREKEQRSRDTALTTLVLALIREQQFEEAMQLIAPAREEVLRGGNLIDVFNYAMAEWGHTHVPPKDLMRKVTQLAIRERYTDANRHQCFALAHHVNGDDERARLEIRRAEEGLGQSGSMFSCWRYLEVSREEMMRDLRTMSEMIGGSPEEPEVFKRGIVSLS